MNLKQLLTNLNPFAKKKPKEESPPDSTEIALDNSKKATWFMTEDNKLKVVAMIARHMTNQEIMESCKEKYGFSVSVAQIQRYKYTEKWKPIIEKMRKEYLSDISTVAGSHKRVRLDRAERVYERAVKKGDIKNQLASIEHERKEVEEKAGVNSISLTLNQFNTLTDEELEERKRQVLEQISKIVPKKEIINGESRIPS